MMRDAAQHGFSERPGVWRLAVAVAVVAGLFSLIVSVLLVANYVQIRAVDPLNHAELLTLRKQLADAPEMDTVLVAQIRALDLLTRKAFFTSQAQLRTGGLLLLGGVAVLLLALKTAVHVRPQLPEPEPEAAGQRYWLQFARSKELIAFASVLLITAALLAAYLAPARFPTTVEKTGAPQERVFPDWETVQRHWPSFRGPGGYGVAHYTNAPTDWDGATGRNIRWKVAPPLPGFNSPVVWGDKVFVSGATQTVREVYCYHADTGALLWKRTLPPYPGTPGDPPRLSAETGYAAPTLSVHGDRVCAIFANGDLACFDLDGAPQWGKNLGLPDNHYGHSSSLIAYGDKLFVQYDDRSDPRLFAFDLDTGEQAWLAQRATISWASPAYIHTAAGVQLLLASEHDVDAYDPKSGTLLWSAKEALGGEVAPSPAYANNTVFVANEYAQATAIRLDTTPETTSASAAWQWDDSLPDVASPVGAGTRFYVATSIGDMICLDSASGETLWEEYFDDGFYASPIVVGERIYALDIEGVMRIVKAAADFELVASPALGEAASATPAFLDGRIYVRTEEHLLCIGQ